MNPFCEQLTRHTIAELGDKVLWHGRTPKRENPVLWYSGSGIEFSVNAGEVWLEFDVAWTGSEEYVRITVNGYEAVRTMLSPGLSQICAYRGMPASEVHTVRVYKETQPISEEGHHLTVTAVYTNGEFLAPPARKWRIEVIGDSITSGEGLAGAVCETAWRPFVFSTRGHYAFLVGEALGADVRVMSFSGNGLASNCWGDPRATLPKRYGYVVGAGEPGEGAGDTFDPSEWGTDAIIVNLGTNDMGATRRPLFVDPKTGENFVMQRDENGNILPETHANIVNAAVAFLNDLRKKNPKLRRIVMIWGMMDDHTDLERAYTEAIGIAGGGITDLLRVPTMDKSVSGMVGARSHPGPATHAAAAEAIIGHMRGLGF